MWVSCMAVSQNFHQIGSWLIYYFFSPLCWKDFFFSFLSLCVHLLPKKKKNLLFFCQQHNYFGVSGSKTVKHVIKWTFTQCSLLPFLPGQVEVFFLASLSNCGVFLLLRAFGLHKIMVLLWYFILLF